MGKVWLVGAGPGDVGMLTLRGKEVLEQAQVVVYDRLVGPGILKLIPDSARCIDVGKRAGNHTMPQEEINQLLLWEAQAGNQVVRLKGGDPFLFGRGGEELELLAQHEIPFEVVPGVTSAIAVPAYSGIPVTHRDCASSLHIITGHRREGEEGQIDFEALVRTRGTLVFLMGASALGSICKGLLEAGMEGDMPAALLQQGTTAEQKKLITTVATLEAEAAKVTIETPAIIVVGKVCSYGEFFSWYEKLPLFGQRILVTRPRERSGELSARLRALGAEVLEFPTIRIVPIEDNPQLEQALTKLPEYNYLVFTSPAGVNVFFDALKNQKKDIRCIGNAQIAVIGPGTRAELEKRGIYAELMPETYDGQNLGILLGSTCQDGDNILIPRAKSGNPHLVEEIAKRKQATVVDVPLYDTVYCCGEIGEKKSVAEENYVEDTAEEKTADVVDIKSMIEDGKLSMVIFTSASTVQGFVSCTHGLNYGLVKAVCIGRRTKEAAEVVGMKAYMAREATLDGLLELVKRLAPIRKRRSNK